MTNLIEAMVHVVCTARRRQIDTENTPCTGCSATEVVGQTSGTRLCRIFAENLARAALAAIEASGTHRVVPVEPTAEMVAAFCGSEGCVSAGAVWGAMLAAAPKVTD